MEPGAFLCLAFEFESHIQHSSVELHGLQLESHQFLLPFGQRLISWACVNELTQLIAAIVQLVGFFLHPLDVRFDLRLSHGRPPSIGQSASARRPMPYGESRSSAMAHSCG